MSDRAGERVNGRTLGPGFANTPTGGMAIAFCGRSLFIMGDRFVYGRSLFNMGDRFLCGRSLCIMGDRFLYGVRSLLLGAIVFYERAIAVVMGDRAVVRVNGRAPLQEEWRSLL
jgi:hypothetical protein